MEESSLFGVSVRAWLSFTTVILGFLFIFSVVFLKDSNDIVSVALTSVIGFVNLALGYYLGQKTSTSTSTTNVNRDA